MGSRPSSVVAAPLPPARYTPLPLSTVVPSPGGWMHAQLTAQRHGLNGKKWLGGGPFPGHVGDSSWVGGGGYDNLEEAYPYWLNGALPLSILLRDDDAGALLEEIERGLDYVFDKARENGGWLGPKFDSPWSSFRFATAVTQYIDAFDAVATLGGSGNNERDDRARRCVSAMFQHASSLLLYLRSNPLKPGSWEHARWVELLESYSHLMSSKHWSMADQGQRDDVINLLKVAQEQGFDWPFWLESSEMNPFVNATISESNIRGWFPNNTADSDSIGENRWMPTVNRQWTHGVNLAQALQVYPLLHRLDSDNVTWLDRGHAAYNRVMNLHGQVTGVFTADENLAGRDPTRGTETCAVVELMNSAFNMFHASGEVRYIDLVERIAYNALPAAFFNGTMFSLNYYQQANKLDALQYAPHCEDDSQACAYCFGLLYECCASNHGQGWPKFIMRQVQISRDGHLAITQYFPSQTKRAIALPDGATIQSLRVETEYPFAQAIKIEVEEATNQFTLELRIPEWCTSARIHIDGQILEAPIKPRTMHPVRVPSGNHEVSLFLPMKIHVDRQPPLLPALGVTISTNAASVRRGPLVYAYPRQHVRDAGKIYDDEDGNVPYGQSHGQNSYLLGIGPWRYALVIENDANPGADLKYQYSYSRPLPYGQGPFQADLVPGRIVAKAILLSEEEWEVKKIGRGGMRECATNTTSIDRYNTSWAGLMPQSPVSSLARVPVRIELVPFGATNLRIAEFVTTKLTRKDDER